MLHNRCLPLASGMSADGNLAVPSGIPAGIDYIRILPELVLSVFGMLVMVVDPLLDEKTVISRSGTIALIGTLAALASTFWMASIPDCHGTAFWNMVRVDDFSVFFHIVL